MSGSPQLVGALDMSKGSIHTPLITTGQNAANKMAIKTGSDSFETKKRHCRHAAENFVLTYFGSHLRTIYIQGFYCFNLPQQHV